MWWRGAEGVLQEAGAGARLLGCWEAHMSLPLHRLSPLPGMPLLLRGSLSKLPCCLHPSLCASIELASYTPFLSDPSRL